MNSEFCTIAFTGDIAFDRYMSGRWTDPELLSPEITAFLRSADHVVANVEGALISADDDGSRGVFFHSIDPQAASLLADIRADIWNISNNHIMDAGEAGLAATLSLAAGMNCRTIGAGENERQASEPVYISKAGGIGIIGVAYVPECIPATASAPGIFRWDDMELIAQRIAEVRSKCRWCVIVAHGGDEFADMPNTYTRDRYLKYLEMGADAVVAHHPHVPENYETFDNGKAIFYSLGNFIFDTDYQRVHPYTDVGVLLKLRFSESEMGFEAMGTKIVRGEEKVISAPLPGIFADVSGKEYERLSPLAAKVFLKEEKKKMIYLEPKRFEHAPDSVWNGYFNSTEPDGYAMGAHMDLSMVLSCAGKAEAGLWRASELDGVKKHILRIH